MTFVLVLFAFFLVLQYLHAFADDFFVPYQGWMIYEIWAERRFIMDPAVGRLTIPPGLFTMLFATQIPSPHIFLRISALVAGELVVTTQSTEYATYRPPRTYCENGLQKRFQFI